MTGRQHYYVYWFFTLPDYCMHTTLPLQLKLCVVQATSIALQAMQSTHCSLSSIASQHNNSSPDFNQQVQLCQQRLQQIASSNAAETSAVEYQHAAVARVQTQTLTLKMKLASAALARSNEQGTQHMAELNLRGVVHGLEVQSGLAKVSYMRHSEKPTWSSL